MVQKHLSLLILICFTFFIAIAEIVNANNSLCTYNPAAYQGLELTQLAQELESTGLIGNIHGAAEKSQLFVLSVREPEDFFSHREFSLLAQNQAALENLKQLKRHDRVCIQGKIITNPSPQTHIEVSSLQILEPWSSPTGFSPYQRATNLPAQLKQHNSLIGKVHAIGAEGKILVVEYQDGVIPIFVKATEYTKNLYRGDIIQLSYQIQSYPAQPTHLQLDTTVEQPLKVLDAIADWHNQAKTLTGKLVKFPQSPQLNFDVYAMEVETQGVKRYFTLVNFENMEQFENIRAKLAQIWDDNLATAVSGRNMLINPQVTIEAQGIINLVSPEQANPQILLDNPAKIRQIN